MRTAPLELFLDFFRRAVKRRWLGAYVIAIT
jgi:hypothetical protein